MVGGQKRGERLAPTCSESVTPAIAPASMLRNASRSQPLNSVTQQCSRTRHAEPRKYWKLRGRVLYTSQEDADMPTEDGLHHSTDGHARRRITEAVGTHPANLVIVKAERGCSLVLGSWFSPVLGSWFFLVLGPWISQNKHARWFAESDSPRLSALEGQTKHKTRTDSQIRGV